MFAIFKKVQHYLALGANSLIATILRYVIFAGGSYWLFWVWKKRAWFHLRIQPRFPPSIDIRREIQWSLSTIAIWAVLGVGILYAQKAGLTRIYTHVSDRGWPYFWASILLMMLMLDTYFYLTHRILHLKPVFRRIHRIHHLSRNPSPFSTFCFHPVEAVVQWSFVPILVFLLPAHPAALGIFFLFTSAVNTLGHLGYETYPAWFNRNPVTRWSNTATFHNMHHTYVNCNYGLYFNWLDTIFGTNHPDNVAYYDEVKERALADQNGA